jgi:hypothetical protein
LDSFIVDDIEKLLKLKKGDSERLNRIKELCENNKLIPISDRKYVERLSSQYLHVEKPKIPTKLNQQVEKPLPKSEKVITEFRQEKVLQSPKIVSSVTSQKHSKKIEFAPNKKIVLAIASIALAIILIGLVATMNEEIFLSAPPEISKTAGLSPPFIYIETDDSSYNFLDIISISGETNPVIHGQIQVSVTNPDGNLVWEEDVQVKDNGQFSTLLIAGGKGWEKSGDYTLNVRHESLRNQIKFSFNA